MVKQTQGTGNQEAKTINDPSLNCSLNDQQITAVQQQQAVASKLQQESIIKPTEVNQQQQQNEKKEEFLQKNGNDIKITIHEDKTDTLNVDQQTSKLQVGGELAIKTGRAPAVPTQFTTLNSPSHVNMYDDPQKAKEKAEFLQILDEQHKAEQKDAQTKIIAMNIVEYTKSQVIGYPDEKLVQYIEKFEIIQDFNIALIVCAGLYVFLQFCCNTYNTLKLENTNDYVISIESQQSRWKYLGKNEIIPIQFFIIGLAIFASFMGWWIVSIMFVTELEDFQFELEHYQDIMISEQYVDFYDFTLFVCWWPLPYLIIQILASILIRKSLSKKRSPETEAQQTAKGQQNKQPQNVQKYEQKPDKQDKNIEQKNEPIDKSQEIKKDQTQDNQKQQSVINQEQQINKQQENQTDIIANSQQKTDSQVQKEKTQDQTVKNNENQQKPSDITIKPAESIVKNTETRKKSKDSPAKNRRNRDKNNNSETKEQKNTETQEIKNPENQENNNKIANPQEKNKDELVV